MGLSVFPAPSAASKTMFKATLTSGTSWTVPAGVTYVNATCVGGGGGGGGAMSYNSVQTAGGTGGTTTFSTISAIGGVGGKPMGIQQVAGGEILGGAGSAAAANSGEGGEAAFTTVSQNTGYISIAGNGSRGPIISGNIATTPGGTVSYSIGAGGTGGSGGRAGGAGGSGRIDLEWWV